MNNVIRIVAALLAGAMIAACGAKETVKKEERGEPKPSPVEAGIPVKTMPQEAGDRSVPLDTPSDLKVSPEEAKAMRERQAELGAIRSYPSELYAGENVLTFYLPEGIENIRPVFDSLTESLTDVRPEDIGTFENCRDSQSVRIRLHTASHALNLRFRITGCTGIARMTRVLNRTWRLDEVPFKDVVAGDTACRPFQIGLTGLPGLGGGEYLDSISVPMPGAFVRYGEDGAPPLRLDGGVLYRYFVCFAPKEPGTYRFPIITWMRRPQPAGGYTNYPVADTAVVRVLKFK